MSSEGDRPPANSLLAQTTVLFRASGQASALSARDRQNLKVYARSLSEKVASAGSFCCVITGDRELQRLNREFLGHDYPTDVLSFPNGARIGDLGEIAISLSRAEAQAQDFGHSCLNELRILMLHGVLHLAGFDHEQDRGEMARAERKWRASFGLPGSLIARSRRNGGASKA